jgi:hypothetical protein
MIRHHHYHFDGHDCDDHFRNPSIRGSVTATTTPTYQLYGDAPLQLPRTFLLMFLLLGNVSFAQGYSSTTIACSTSVPSSWSDQQQHCRHPFHAYFEKRYGANKKSSHCKSRGGTAASVSLRLLLYQSESDAAATASASASASASVISPWTIPTTAVFSISTTALPTAVSRYGESTASVVTPSSTFSWTKNGMNMAPSNQRQRQPQFARNNSNDTSNDDTNENNSNSIHMQRNMSKSHNNNHTTAAAVAGAAPYHNSSSNNNDEDDGTTREQVATVTKSDAVDTNTISTGSYDDDILSYLGHKQGSSVFPPQTRDLLCRITYNYIFGTNDDIITLQEIASVIECEHRSKDVPVQIMGGSGSLGSNFVVFVADVTKTGEAFDELCAEILSFGALYQLPKEIILELLSAPIHSSSSRTSSTSVLDYSNSLSSSSIIRCRSAFAAVGWKGVVFPMGLAIRPKTKFRNVWTFPFLRNAARKENSNINQQNQQQQRVGDDEVTLKTDRSNTLLPLSWWHRTKTLREVSTKAVQNAAVMLPPPRQLIDRRKYLNTLDAQIRELSSPNSRKTFVSPTSLDTSDDTWSTDDDVSTTLLPPLVAPGVGFVPTRSTMMTPTTATTTGQLYFPNTERQWWQTIVTRRSIGSTIRTVRRVLNQQYNALKRQGHAGLISYCFFNFLYYTMGMLWQWPRMAILQNDPVTNLSSSVAGTLSLLPLQQQQHTIPTLLFRKLGKIFAYLYAFSQLLKIPKLCTAVGLAPLASKSLEMIKVRFGVKETMATAILITFMIVVWCTIVAVPILSEYASLKNIFYLEEQFMQVYGLQPV